MKIEFLVSTMNRTDSEFLKKMFENVESSDYLVKVVNQCTKIEPLLHINESNIKVVSLKEKGLSNSRNRLLEIAEGDVCIIADDDLVYLDSTVVTIKNAFTKYPNFDLIRFMFRTSEGTPCRSYSPQKHLMNFKKISSTTSGEIAFRRKSVMDKNISFDVVFGLGAKFLTGEDAIFVRDCLSNKLKALFIPSYIAIHPAESSGIDYANDETLPWAKGAALTRLFWGNLSIFAIIYFAIRQKRIYKKRYSIPEFIKLLLNGRRDYLNYIKSRQLK